MKAAAQKKKAPAQKKKARGRPSAESSDAVVAAVLGAVLDEIVARGVTGIRMDHVARVAGVNKTSIYRRWATREELIIAALKSARGDEPPFVERGHVRDDLVALFERKARFLSTERGRAVTRALIAVADTKNGEALARLLRVERTAAAQAIIAKAIARGDVDKHADPQFLSELVFAPILYRLLHGAEPFRAGEIARIVDAALAGVLR